MKLAFSTVLFLCFLASILHAQNKVVTIKKVAVYPPFRSFFEKHRELKEIRFRKEWMTDSLELDMVEKDTSAIKAFNHFDLDDAGGRYFFKKRFGSFVLLSLLYTDLLNPKAENADISGVVRNDSIFFSIKEIYFPKNDDEKYFIKTEPKWGYIKGLHIIAQGLEANLSCINVPVTDSIVIAKYLLEKNGTLTKRSVEKGNQDSDYTKALLRCLSTSEPWKPAEAGGRPVRAYIRIYVRLNSDGTYWVAMD